MNTVNYRLASRKDLEHIVAIYNEIIDEGGYSADLDHYTIQDRVDWFHELNTDLFGIYVVQNDNNITGFLYFSPWRKGRRALAKTVEVSFYLKASSRGSGIGKKIMLWISELAVSKKYKALIAILLDTNTRSKHLLEKSGFKVGGHFENTVQLSDRNCGQWLMLKYLN